MAAASLGFLRRCRHHLLLSAVVLFFPPPSDAQPCSSVTFSNRLFAACNDLPHLSSSIHWTFDAANSTLSVAFAAPPDAPDGWISWAINPTGAGMLGSQSLIAFHQSDGSMGVKTFNVSGYAIAPSPIDFPTSDLAAEYTGGKMRIFAKVYLPRGMGTVNQVWQVGGSVTAGIPGKHSFGPENLAAKGILDLIRGKSTVLVDSRLKKRNIHGILNAVSWGILLPMGAIMARYLKTFKSADPAWFYLHVSCQLIGYGVGVAGWATGLDLGKKSKGVQHTTHRNIGITLFSLATLQVFALFVRPNKDHKYRFYWNVYHHLVGYTVIVLGIVNVFEGLQILSPGEKWRRAYIIVICTLGGISLFLEAITWTIAIRRKSNRSAKLYDNAYASNGNHGIQQPSSV